MALSAFGAFAQGMAGSMDSKRDRKKRDQDRAAIDQRIDALRDMQMPQAMGVDGAGQTMPARSGGASGVSNNPDLMSGILETAGALEMDPVDLATIISYETAGTFDPTKRGPTTQWGQHRGLIQFGEPQAEQYGVDWNNPVGSQLGPDGAVARYFRQNGWRSGMSMLDAYSIVNAGAPGRYNASDANNGGAPGTVRDKVTNQMADHRAKAQAMIEQYRASLPPAAPAQRTFQSRPLGVGRI